MKAATERHGELNQTTDDIQTTDDMVTRKHYSHSLAVRNRLTGLLALKKEDPYMQDWPLEICDSDRVSEFIDAYRSLDLNEDERFSLMQLIFYSLDEATPDDRSTYLAEVKRLVLKEYFLHKSTIDYWCSDGEKQVDNCFALTPFAREIRSRATGC